MFLSVVIPVFNEERIIRQNLSRVINFLNKKNYRWELIIVDDGSVDTTLTIAKQFSEVKIFQNEKNLGKGVAVQRGILAGQGEWLLFLDADLSTDIKELDNFLNYTENFDIIIGNRRDYQTKIITSQPGYRVILGRLGNLLIRWLLQTVCQDTQCGFKLFNKRCKIIFEKQKLKGWGFDFEILYLARTYNFKIKELGVNWQDSQDSKMRLKGYWQTLKELIKIKYNILTKKYE